MKRSMTGLILAVLVLALPGMAQATPFTYTDYSTSGDRLILQDATSGLEWLSLSETKGMSTNEPAVIDGWTLATKSQLRDLFVNNTSTNTPLISSAWNVYYSINFPADQDSEVTQELLSFFTGTPDEGTALGYLSKEQDSYSFQLDMGSITRTLDSTFQINAHFQGPLLGTSSFLVRETAPTPIPGAVWLLGSGLVGLVGLKRKKFSA